jgi:hypothetical protein
MNIQDHQVIEVLKTYVDQIGSLQFKHEKLPKIIEMYKFILEVEDFIMKSTNFRNALLNKTRQFLVLASDSPEFCVLGMQVLLKYDLDDSYEDSEEESYDHAGEF